VSILTVSFSSEAKCDSKIKYAYDVDEKYVYYYDSENKKYCVVMRDDILYSIYAEEDDDVLKEAVIPDGITTLVEESLNAVRAESIYIPASVTEIRTGAVNTNRSAVEFVVDENNPKYCSKDGILYTKDMKHVIVYPAKRKADVVMVDDKVEDINQFWTISPPEADCIIFPENLKSVPDFIHFKSIYISSDSNDLRASVEHMIKFTETVGMELDDYSEDSPKIIYLSVDSPYIELFEKSKVWLVVYGNNYGKKHARIALKMASGEEKEQIDLRIYKETGEKKVLFDENQNGKVDMEDVRTVFEKAEGRTVTDAEWQAFCDDNLGGSKTDETPQDKFKGKLYGDFDLDGKVTLNDAKKALRLSLGIDNATEDEAYLGNLNGGGITLNEAKAFLRMSLGIDKTKQI